MARNHGIVARCEFVHAGSPLIALTLDVLFLCVRRTETRTEQGRVVFDSPSYAGQANRV